MSGTTTIIHGATPAFPMAYERAHEDGHERGADGTDADGREAGKREGRDKAASDGCDERRHFMMCMSCAVPFTTTDAHDTATPCTATGPFYSMSATEVERMVKEDAREARRTRSMCPPIPGFAAGHVDESELGHDSWQMYYQTQDFARPDPLSVDTKAHTPRTPHKTPRESTHTSTTPMPLGSFPYCFLASGDGYHDHDTDLRWIR
jgi:hypothetical protein